MTSSVGHVGPYIEANNKVMACRYGHINCSFGHAQQEVRYTYPNTPLDYPVSTQTQTNEYLYGNRYTRDILPSGNDSNYTNLFRAFTSASTIVPPSRAIVFAKHINNQYFSADSADATMREIDNYINPRTAKIGSIAIGPEDMYITSEDMYVAPEEKYPTQQFEVTKERFGGHVEIKEQKYGEILSSFIKDPEVIEEKPAAVTAWKSLEFKRWKKK